MISNTLCSVQGFLEFQFPWEGSTINDHFNFLTKQIITAYEIFNLPQKSGTKKLTFTDPKKTDSVKIYPALILY